MGKNKTPLDIIYISAHYPPDIGGLEITMEKMFREHLLNNDKVIVVTGKNPKRKLPKNNQVIRFNRYEIFRNTWIIPKMFSFLLKTNKRIYYAHYGVPFIPEISYIISKLKSQKLVIHYHLDLFGTTPFTKILINIYNQTIIRFILKRANAIIVPTNSYRIFISKKYGIDRKKIFYSMPAIDIEKFSQIKSQKHGGFNILFIGNLKDQKNVPLLINAFDILANKYPDMNLFIVGTGIREKQIKMLASEKRNRSRIYFFGKVPNKEIGEYFGRSDLFVLPSLTESAGIVILEAFAAKIPVVATKILGVIDLLGKTRGILVGNGDVESLVNGIEKIYLKKVDVKKIVDEAYNFVEDYSWKKMTERVNKIFKKLQ